MKSAGAPDRARMRAAIERCAKSADYIEGRRAFMEKRKPRFTRHMKITNIRWRAVAAPMKRPLATSVATLTASALLLIDLETDAGIVGRSYLFGMGKHNLPPMAKLVEAMTEMVKGDEVAPLDIERKLRARYALLGVHNVGAHRDGRHRHGGLGRATRKSLGQPLVRVLGAAPRPIPAYNSKGLGIMEVKPLVQEATELVEEGFRAIKLRMGRPDARADIEALRAVKKAIGPEVTLMVDFNQALTRRRSAPARRI